MPYAKSNKTSTTPRPAPRRPKRPIDVTGPQNPAATLIESTGTWNFSARIWIAFDPPTSTSPTWVDVSGFVKTNSPITITHGRSDGLSDVNATTCTLTVDNSDGRFLAANAAGPWYGLVHKGNWLKVEIFPPSGTVSQRFVGFITSLPNQWSGQYQYGQIAASDRFEKLGGVPAVISMIESEVLADPNLASGNPAGASVQAYYGLHEPQGSTTFGDTSGSLARYLSLASIGGVPPGTGFGAANVNAPGFDGLQCVTFNPVSTSQGTYLTAPISPPTGTWTGGTYVGLMGTLEFWFQTITANTQQFLAAIIDPIAQVATTISVDSSGFLEVAAAGSTPTNPISYFGISSNQAGASRIDDGKWHHVVVGTGVASGNIDYYLFVDGKSIANGSIVGTGGTTVSAFTQLVIGAGIDFSAPGFLKAGAANISDFAWLWADLWSANGSSPILGAYPPDIVSHYSAGTTGFLGEATDQRVARVARYAGVPIPLAQATDALGFSRVRRYSRTQGPWTNLSAGAHLVGTQSMAGRKPLDVMLEGAHTEDMPLYANRSGYLEMQPSTTRQNTSPAWSVNALELDPSTAVADDFAYTTNTMTVTPNGQAAQTVIGASGSPGRLSLAKYGEYDGSQATASVTPVEAQSLGLAYIQLRADPAPRLAPLAIEAATAALLPGYGSAWYDAILATEISTPVRVTNAPAAVGGGTYDCLVEGWTEAITAGNHLFQFNVSPIQGPTYQLDDAVLGHIDTDGSTLAGSTLNTTSLTFQVATTNAGSPLWTTAGADFPFDIRIDGEQITISGVSGVSSPQTFTASARSVNGIVATHNVGAAVSLWQPLTLAY